MTAPNFAVYEYSLLSNMLGKLSRHRVDFCDVDQIDLDEIRLNAGDIGYDHISKFYLDGLETIIGTEVKITI